MNSHQLQRLQTLAEVARIAALNPSEFPVALDEFVDEFYLDYPNKMAQQQRLDSVPQSAGNPLIDAWIGAVGEHLAQRWRLKLPDWTQRDFHFALRDPVFLPSEIALRGVVIVESPPAFRSRLIFTRAERWLGRGFQLAFPALRSLLNGRQPKLCELALRKEWLPTQSRFWQLAVLVWNAELLLLPKPRCH